MVFGSFDPIEKRHEQLFHAAAEHGDVVMAVVARDATGHMDSGDLTEREYERFAGVMAIDVVDDVILAHGDHIDVIRAHRPHMVVIGAHQKELVDTLSAHSDVLRACGCVMVHV